jgi:hypothetical protein
MSQTSTPIARWAFFFLMVHIAIHFTQPQNRFLFFYPFKIAQLSILIAMGLHLASVLTEERPLLRMGPATILGFTLMFFGLIAQYFGALQTNTGWNGYIDQLMKSALVMILLDAMATTIYRVWAVQATVLLATLWWVKAGLRLGTSGAFYGGDRIMGPGVSMVENPNGFAYMFCVVLPVYLYFYQQYPKKYFRIFFMVLIFSAIYSIFNTGSRTGMVLMISLGVFLFPKYLMKYKVALIIGAIATSMILGATGQMNIERFKTIPDSIRAFFSDEELSLERTEGADDHSAVERKLKNRDTWALIKEYPLFGVGMNPNEGEFAGRFPYATGQVHNEWLMAGRQMGFIGIGLYFSLLILIGAYGWRVKRYAEGWWPAMADLGWTLRLQALAIFVGGSFSPMPWNIFTFVLAGAASALWMNLRLEYIEQGYEPADVVASAPAVSASS